MPFMKAQLIDVGSQSKRSIQIKLVEQKYLTTPLHFHEMCELVYIETSYGKRIVGDHVGDFKEGDLVLLGPDLPHIWLNDDIYQQPDSENTVSSLVIYFPPDFLLNLTDDNSITFLTEGLIMRSHRGLQFYGKTLEKVVDKLNSLKHETGMKKMLTFLSVIDILAESDEYRYLASISYKNPFNTKDAQRINTLYQFLNKNFKREISLNEAARVANMSTGAFCRFFKSRTQKSFSLFVNELRIGHACKLLMEDDQSVTAIAFECGYQNLTNFNKFFKRITGRTPTQYKKQIAVPY